MRLLSWNILHGGGSRRPAIAEAIAALAADVVLLQEVRAWDGRGPDPLLEGLRAAPQQPQRWPWPWQPLGPQRQHPPFRNQQQPSCDEQVPPLQRELPLLGNPPSPCCPWCDAWSI